MAEALNRQRILNFLDTFYSGDIEGALNWCNEDVTFIANAPVDVLPHMGSHKGKAALRAMWQTIGTRYSEMRYTITHMVAEGDKVAALIRLFFRKRKNDRIVQFDLAAFYTLHDGKISEIREVLDSFELVQQLLERDVAAALAIKPGEI